VTDTKKNRCAGVVAQIVERLKQRFCQHAFAIEDVALVNANVGDERVRWPCSRCGKVFRAHCGLDITPQHGFLFRRAGRAPTVEDAK